MTSLDVETRPAVARVASLPAAYGLKPAERLVLLALACDSYDGETSAPGMDALAEWTGLFRGAAYDVVKALSAPTDRRPALIERSSTRGRNRTVFRLILEPSDDPGRLPAADSGTGPAQPSGEPSDDPGRFVAGHPVDKSGEPSGQPSGQPSGEPSGNPGLPPSLPFLTNPPPHGESHLRQTSRWAGEECDVRRPRGPHQLDEDGLVCVHCNTRAPDVTAVERDGIVARRKLSEFHRDRGLPIAVDELLEHADRLGDGDILAGARVVRQIVDEPMPTKTRDPAKLLRHRLRNTRARRVQAA